MTKPMDLYLSNLKRVLSRSGILAAVLVLGACEFAGNVGLTGPLDNPAIRKVTWFSYVAGEDIRKYCKEGAQDQYRFINNAVYDEQVRSFDLKREAGSNSFTLITRVTGEANLLQISLDPASPDLLSPWRPRVSEKRLRQADVDTLVKKMRASAFFQPAPSRLELPSYGFYWVVSACHGGEFHFNAYLWPSPRYAAIEFADQLFDWDGTPTAVNMPRPTTPFEIYGTNDEGDYINFFYLKLDQQGRL